MKLHFTDENLESIKHRCLVVFADRDGNVLNGGPAFAELLAPFVESGEFGRSFKDEIFLTEPKAVAAQRVLFFNVGKKIKGADDYRKSSARAWKSLRKKRIKDVLVSVAGLNEAETRAVAEGFFLGDYNFTELKTKKENLPVKLENLTFHGAGSHADAIARWQIACGGTNRARDLYQLPANILNPVTLSEKALAWGEEFGFKTTVMEEDEMRELGMGSLLSVSQGSVLPARMMIMEYEPENPSGKTFCFVGKAVTFDSGGLSLKPSAGMAEMKNDMGGGATVLGIMTCLKAMNCPHRVVGLVPSVENMPSGSATRPSDVVTSLSGKTVEINNTDAEGRLILIDALTYAERFKPDYVMDFATLTGACLVALGPKCMAVMGNHKPLVDAVLKASEETHELFWELPLIEEYEELLDSDVADISNISSTRWGGTITAGLFLKEFAGDYQWAHCDIAPAMFEKEADYHPVGGTGIGVRMTLSLLEKGV